VQVPLFAALGLIGIVAGTLAWRYAAPRSGRAAKSVAYGVGTVLALVTRFARDSLAYAGDGQHQDIGGKVIHVAPRTTSSIVSKSISKGTGRSSYRGLLKVHEGAHHARSNVECDALLINDTSRTDTYPYIEIDENDANVGHEASVSKLGEDQLFYLMSRGIAEEDASKMVVNGFVEPIVKELPMEYAIELNRLIELQMEGSVG